MKRLQIETHAAPQAKITNPRSSNNSLPLAAVGKRKLHANDWIWLPLVERLKFTEAFIVFLLELSYIDGAILRWGFSIQVTTDCPAPDHAHYSSSERKLFAQLTHWVACCRLRSRLSEMRSREPTIRKEHPLYIRKIQRIWQTDDWDFWQSEHWSEGSQTWNGVYHSFKRNDNVTRRTT